MKILLIGASGTIGKAVAKALANQHEVIAANYSGGDVSVDIGKQASIKAMFEQVGNVDAIVSTAGLANFAALAELTDADYDLALNNKLMGQINLMRIGKNYLSESGSVTLTSGVLSQEPMQGSSVISMANGALESFIKAANLELENMRINAVSPIFVKETMAMMGMDTKDGLSAKDTAKAYVAAITGTMSGKTLAVTDYM